MIVDICYQHWKLYRNKTGWENGCEERGQLLERLQKKEKMRRDIVRAIDTKRKVGE